MQSATLRAIAVSLSLCGAILGAGCGPSGGADDGGVEDDLGADGSSTPVDLGPCGNGVIDPGETCDDSNGTAGDGCSTACQLEIGWDGAELCDNGAANSHTAYGQDQCTKSCQPAPYCGDGVVSASFGEECDSTAACSSTCKLGVL